MSFVRVADEFIFYMDKILVVVVLAAEFGAVYWLTSVFRGTW